jgi:hypothetical protein
MAELATNIGVVPQTILASTSAISRGYRVTLASDGTVSASAIGVRGDYIAVNDIAASSYGIGHACGTGAKISAVASEAVAVGDAAYSAASGKFSKTSTNAVLMGKWVQAASGDGVLGVVQLETVA